MKKRVIALALGCAVAFGGAVGGTLAWLTDSTTEVTNTFTTSDVDIDLTETKGGDNKEFQMVPGHTIAKDPKVTVSAGSQPCWLFVKVEETIGSINVGETQYGFDDFISYKLLFDDASTSDVEDNSGFWTAGTGTDEGGNGIPTNVYYKKIVNTGEGANAGDPLLSDVVFNIIGYNDGTQDIVNKVLVNSTVTKEMMNAVTTGENGNQPKLTFQTAAIQLYQTNDTEFEVEDAYKQLPTAFTGATN